MDIKQIIADHAKWLADSATGRRASLDDANLDGVNLAGAILAGASLAGASLVGANLAHANLAHASLAHASLAHANLEGVNLAGAILNHANLVGATLPAGVPIVPNIDAAILAAIGKDASGLNMNDWHCKTTHSRAGWAVKLAGKAGKALEKRFGTGTAGALIYAASRPGMPVPNFFATNADALADLRKCAEMAE